MQRERSRNCSAIIGACLIANPAEQIMKRPFRGARQILAVNPFGRIFRQTNFHPPFWIDGLKIKESRFNWWPALRYRPAQFPRIIQVAPSKLLSFAHYARSGMLTTPHKSLRYL